ncbi:hypothetical protein SAMN02982922_0643 [Mesorhizobium australicum]|uniref:Uncharacterized protein n=1 Tax=Mesorhizobium australicum TaxID=536018 RepID=A0A1X7MU25_9HYPH|nr:hypothetical protein SAMN02982922_0643 [Mesorhizobium australicum]
MAKHRRGVGEPRHLDRTAGLKHYHRARIGLQHGRDELFLPARKHDYLHPS